MDSSLIGFPISDICSKSTISIDFVTNFKRSPLEYLSFLLVFNQFECHKNLCKCFTPNKWLQNHTCANIFAWHIPNERFESFSLSLSTSLSSFFFYETNRFDCCIDEMRNHCTARERHTHSEPRRQIEDYVRWLLIQQIAAHYETNFPLRNELLYSNWFSPAMFICGNIEISDYRTHFEMKTIKCN